MQRNQEHSQNKSDSEEFSPARIAYQLLAAEDEGRVCKDIPESACNHQTTNFVTHVVSLAMTKSADGLINPKLVLSWILTHLGAPAYFVGLLVPIREAGALLPQLFIAGFLRSLPRRKFAWALGSLIQGLSALGMALAAFTLEGKALGLALVSLLALLALARSLCSVSYKDVLGKTVSKSRRGTATGTASSLASGLVILFALLLASGWVDKLTLVTLGLALAGLLWLLATWLFLTLAEEAGATEGGANPFTVAREHLSYLVTDRQLFWFIVTRGLLMATALAPPYMVALAATDTESGFAGLGWLVLASSLAALLSSRFWGRLADRSSRKVLMLCGACAGVALLLTALARQSGVVNLPGVLPLLLFGLMIAYEGVRLGRSTHLVDMANAERRAAYTALSNTVIGLLLVLGGLFSVVANAYGEQVVLIIFAMMSGLAVLAGYQLNEAQEEAREEVGDKA